MNQAASKPARYGSRCPLDATRTCLLCNAPVWSSRAIYYSAACKHLAFGCVVSGLPTRIRPSLANASGDSGCSRAHDRRMSQLR
jgi:hypothetical protein